MHSPSNIVELNACLLGADHAAIYDLSNDALYFVYASPFINNTFVPAYFRSWIKVSLTSLWSVTPPESDF